RDPVPGRVQRQRVPPGHHRPAVLDAGAGRPAHAVRLAGAGGVHPALLPVLRHRRPDRREAGEGAADPHHHRDGDRDHVVRGARLRAPEPAAAAVALFCTGVQSTLFGPVKYAILPSVLRPEERTGGNGLVEMGTSVSILLGMIAGGLVFAAAGTAGPWAAGAAVVALAIAGNLASRWIPPAGAGAPDLQVRWNPIPESIAVLRLARRQLAVRNAILGISWFWFVGTVFATQLPDYAVAHLGGSGTLYVFALALFSIGTGAGSMLCEKLSA